MKRILVLGAGLVTRPLVRYLLENGEMKVIVASRTVSKAQALIENHPKGTAIELNVKDNAKLEKLVGECDIAISLLPYIHHVQVAELCLKYKKQLITTSYVSPAMKELDSRAREAGVLFLNEIGLDPGIDHMSAMKIINDVKEREGKIISFESVCGGLPAPEANDNPFGYKFSWSPRGVLLAGRNNAQFRKDGNEIKLQGKDLFTYVHRKKVGEAGELEVYPNRDSMIYKDLYGLNDSKTIFRGTFRNIGWCETLLVISRSGFLDDTERPELNGKPWKEIVAFLIGADSADNIRAKFAEKAGITLDSDIMKRLEWLGIFSEQTISSDPPSYLDFLTVHMERKLKYQPGERDMIVLQHQFVAEFPGGAKEAITSLMIDFGIPGGDSSMARTVSLPAAVAARMIAEDKINITGVHIPNMPEIYLPVLDELENMNIRMKDTYTKL